MTFNPRNLSLPTIDSLKEPKAMVRAGLGLLVAANLVAALFAFHLVGASPEALNRQLAAARVQLQASQMRLNRSRLLTSNIDRGRTESETFLATYLTGRRHTYSTIIGDLTEIAETAGMKMQETTIGLDPIEGSDDLDMMTISANFEGTAGQLVKLVNLIDRSPRFMIIESMQAAPQTKGDLVSVNLKLNVFVRDDTDGSR